MKKTQTQALLALGVASLSMATKNIATNTHQLDSVYVTASNPGLTGIDAIFRGGETVIAGLGAAEVPIYYQSLFPTTSTDYNSAIYSFNSFSLIPIDAILDANFPDAIALVSNK